jgi:hypothetical protein
LVCATAPVAHGIALRALDRGDCRSSSSVVSGRNGGHDGLNAETLIKNADAAMQQAKENGRQRYQYFKPAVNVRAAAELSKSRCSSLPSCNHPGHAG